MRQVRWPGRGVLRREFLFERLLFRGKLPRGGFDLFFQRRDELWLLQGRTLRLRKPRRTVLPDFNLPRHLHRLRHGGSGVCDELFELDLSLHLHGLREGGRTLLCRKPVHRYRYAMPLRQRFQQLPLQDLRRPRGYLLFHDDGHADGVQGHRRRMR